MIDGTGEPTRTSAGRRAALLAAAMIAIERGGRLTRTRTPRVSRTTEICCPPPLPVHLSSGAGSLSSPRRRPRQRRLSRARNRPQLQSTLVRCHGAPTSSSKRATRPGGSARKSGAAPCASFTCAPARCARPRGPVSNGLRLAACRLLHRQLRWAPARSRPRHPATSIPVAATGRASAVAIGTTPRGTSAIAAPRPSQRLSCPSGHRGAAGKRKVAETARSHIPTT